MRSDSMEIYLDMNVVVDCFQGRDDFVKEKVLRLKKGRVIFPYSPAHIEEVAVILRKQKDQDKADKYVKAHLEYISQLSDGWEYLPSDAGIILKKESPDTCFGRVIDMYDRTIFAENNERYIQCFRDEKSCLEYFNSNGENTGSVEGMPMFAKFREHHGIDKMELANTSPENIFRNENVRRALDAKLMFHSFYADTLPMHEDMVNSHNKIELVVGILLNFLEEIGFRPEPRGRYRSRMHDVTHAIYATRAKYFVTGDQRYLDKVKAVYSLLGIPCRVADKTEFMNNVDKPFQN